MAPADIKYPTDIDLLNKSREHLETAVDILWKKYHTRAISCPIPRKQQENPIFPWKKQKVDRDEMQSCHWRPASVY